MSDSKVCPNITDDRDHKLEQQCEDWGDNFRLEYWFCYSCQKRYYETIVRNSAPEFTEEQIEWLKDMLTPRCCHTSGMHDPCHYTEQKYVCKSQKAECYDHTRLSLGMGRATPQEAIPSKSCSRCNKKE